MIEPGTLVHTDGWLGYDRLTKRGYRHRITFLRGQPQSPADLLPRVHRVVSLLKRWLLGTHQRLRGDRLLRRCLEKDRKRRLADAADAKLEIDDALASPAQTIARRVCRIEDQCLPIDASSEKSRRNLIDFAQRRAYGRASLAAAHRIVASPPEARCIDARSSDTEGAPASLRPSDGGWRICLRTPAVLTRNAIVALADCAPASQSCELLN